MPYLIESYYYVKDILRGGHAKNIWGGEQNLYISIHRFGQAGRKYVLIFARRKFVNLFFINEFSNLINFICH